MRPRRFLSQMPNHASPPFHDYAASGSAKFTSEAFEKRIHRAFPFPRLLASASTNGTVCLWDPDTGGLITTLDIGDGEIKSMQPSRKTVVFSMDDGFIKLYDTNTMNHINDLEHQRRHHLPHTTSDALFRLGRSSVCLGCWHGRVLGGSTGFDAIQALAFSKDGETLRSGCNDGTITVWDMKTRTLVNHCTMDHDFHGKKVGLLSRNWVQLSSWICRRGRNNRSVQHPATSLVNRNPWTPFWLMEPMMAIFTSGPWTPS